MSLPVGAALVAERTEWGNRPVSGASGVCKWGLRCVFNFGSGYAAVLWVILRRTQTGCRGTVSLLWVSLPALLPAVLTPPMIEDLAGPGLWVATVWKVPGAQR